MLQAIRPRVTYANVVATGALFVALGGGAYALSGIPDSGGVYHGCVHDQTRVLRVVGSRSSCQKAKTVKRGRRRIRIPGETVIAWNQQGRPGINGANGTNGVNGTNAATNVVVRTASFTNVGGAQADVQCNAGERAVAGGVSRSNGGAGAGDSIKTSFPEAGGPPNTPAPSGATPTGWFSAINLSSTSDVTFYAICASP